MSGRTTFVVEARYAVQMDDTPVGDAEDILKARFNEMLGRMERDDDIRIVLVHDFDVKEQR